MPPASSARWGIEHLGCPSVLTSEDEVKSFGQGRISRPINGSKLIFDMKIYLSETSRNIQEP